MSVIRVLIADRHTIFREGLTALLGREKDIRVIGEASTGKEAIEQSRALKPSIVISDVALPDRSGLQVAAQILKDNPRIRIVILSAYDDQELLAQAAKVGVKGYLVKQTAAGELLAALREVHRGYAYYSTAMSRVVLALNERPRSVLTCRETDVLQQIALGSSNRQISATMAISIKTVEKHRQQIMNKLNIHDAAGLTRFAVANGFV